MLTLIAPIFEAVLVLSIFANILGCTSPKHIDNDTHLIQGHAFTDNYYDITRAWAQRMIIAKYVCDTCDTVGIMFSGCYSHEFDTEIDSTPFEDIQSEADTLRLPLPLIIPDNDKFHDTVYAQCSCLDSNASQRYYVWFCTFWFTSLKSETTISLPALGYSFVIPFDYSALYFIENEQ